MPDIDGSACSRVQINLSIYTYIFDYLSNALFNEHISHN